MNISRLDVDHERNDRRGFTLLELLIVMVILAVLSSVLLPMLSKARSRAIKAQMESRAPAIEAVLAGPAEQAPTPPRAPHADIRSFDAKVDLTPRLSVGTAQPESIYEAAFSATLSAQRGPQPAVVNGLAVNESEIELPLPPQIISLGNLTMLINGQPSDAFEIRADKLVWRGQLPEGAPTQFTVTYSAIGKGVYALQTPPGKILDQFKLEMTAHGSDVRMLELSMQPTSLDRSAGTTRYVWDYKRLMFGRPIAVDVLGIAPIDRLGELSWLGPLSVVAFGIVIGLIARAYQAADFDKWMLLLVLGLFTGAYPLMYFAQEFVSLRLATSITGAIVLGVIMLRVISLMGWRLGLLGVVLPAALIMTLAITAATHPNLQGILLTCLGLALFALGMMLAPKLSFANDVGPRGEPLAA